MFCLRSPRRQHRRVETFRNPDAEQSNYDNYANPIPPEVKNNYQEILETKRSQQSMLSNQLRQEIESKRRLLDMQNTAISIQQQTDFLMNQFRSFKRPEPANVLTNQYGSAPPPFKPQLMSLRDFIKQSPRRIQHNNVKNSILVQNEEFAHPVRANFAKMVLPTIKPLPGSKELTSTSQLVYPDGHSSSLDKKYSSRLAY